jgi:hypothetical protein
MALNDETPAVDGVEQFFGTIVTMLLVIAGGIGVTWVGFSVLNPSDQRSLALGTGAMVFLGSIGLLVGGIWLGRKTTAIREVAPEPRPPRWWSPVGSAAFTPITAVYGIAELQAGSGWGTTAYCSLALLMIWITRSTIIRYRKAGDPSRSGGKELFEGLGVPASFVLVLLMQLRGPAAELKLIGAIASITAGVAVGVYMHWTRLDTLGPK